MLFIYLLFMEPLIGQYSSPKGHIFFSQGQHKRTIILFFKFCYKYVAGFCKYLKFVIFKAKHKEHCIIIFLKLLGLGPLHMILVSSFKISFQSFNYTTTYTIIHSFSSLRLLRFQEITG